MSLDAYDLARINGFTGDRLEFFKQIYEEEGFEAALRAGFAGSESELITQPMAQDAAARELFKMLVGPTGRQGEKGDQGEPGRDGRDGIDGLNGRDGIDGRDGVDGSMPMHQLDGKRLRFQLPDGSWGEWIDLSAFSDSIGSSNGGSVSIQKFYASESEFPVVGKPQILYFDQSTAPFGVYIWTGIEYTQIGGFPAQSVWASNPEW